MSPNTIDKLQFLNEKFLFLKTFNSHLNLNDEPKFFIFGGQINHDNFSEYSSSLHHKKEQAILLTYGEAMERFHLSNFMEESLIYDKYVNLPENTLQIEKIINKSNIDAETSKSKKLHWSKIFSEFDKKELFIPSQLIYMPFHKDNYFIRKPISTGTAAGETEESAIYRGICECIERDNFIITYLNKTSPKTISIEDINDEDTSSTINYFERYKLKPNLYKLNSETIFSTILCVLEDETEHTYSPAISIGTSTDTNIYNAIKKSMYEALKTRIWIRKQIIKYPDRYLKIKSPNDISSSMIERGFFWAHTENKKYLDFIIKSNFYHKITEEETKKLTFTEKLEILKKYLYENDFDLLVKDLTFKEIKKSGFNVYKVIIPQLHPLFLYESFKYDISPRTIKPEHQNKIPHPFL